MVSQSNRLFLAAAVLWCMVLAGSFGWNWYLAGEQGMENAFIDARASMNKDISFRRWANDHGGVYVPVTPTQKSIPWLEHVPGRDATTTDGRALTLLNPASVLRQVMDRYTLEYGVRGRIIGLKQLNPANAPDAWERAQLLAFERGDKTEVWERDQIDGKPHLRHLRAMWMEPGCDKCHGILGYKTGDLRGAIGLSLPLGPYLALIHESRVALGLTHGGIWLAGMLGLGLSARRFRRHDRATALQERRRKRAQFRLEDRERKLVALRDELQATLNAIPDLMFEWGLDGCIHSYRTARTELLALPPEEFLGRNLSQVLPPDVARVCLAALQEAHENGEASGVQYALTLPAGTKWFELSVARKGAAHTENPRFIVLARDVTERKKVEQDLLESGALNAQIIAGAQIGIVVYGLDMCYQVWNPFMEHMTGLKALDLVGRKPLDVFPFLKDSGVIANLESALAGKSVEASEFPFEVAQTGVQGWARDRTASLRAPDGRVVGAIAMITDITHRKGAEARQKLAAGVFTYAREGITITDATGSILEVNDAFTRITGYSRDEVLGKNPRLLQSGRQSPQFYDEMWRDLTAHGYWSGEIWNRHKEGYVYAETLTISAVRGADGATQNYIALFADITESKEHAQQLEHTAHFDALTGLPNRVLLADRLRQAMIQTQRRNQSLVVAYMDLDGFKEVNDRHGHGVGDILLVAIAERLKSTLREGDTLARIGGDEFVAVMLDLTQWNDCEPILARLCKVASDTVMVGDIALRVSVSIGVTTSNPQGDDADLLIRHADQAMYTAKQAGKNRYHLFDLAQDDAVRQQRESIEGIRLALEQREFVLYYQPKVDMRSGLVVGVEALIRWQHPERGLLAPAAFLPAIEDHPFSISLGDWVMDATMVQIAQWQEQGLHLRVSVNVGALQLQSDGFVERLSELLARHPMVAPECLELEILETSALKDVSRVSDIMHACKAMGVRFSLDDFGTGYSSLTYLKYLPAQTLKIDQSFVRDMLEDADDLAIVKGVVGLARVFGREVIAEGVETQAHGALLQTIDCALAQGYGIARPMPAQAVLPWVHGWHANPSWTA
jgi:diguanylate cyclase (GGDEF)-like protein/PAS domain S-box-containing protein